MARSEQRSAARRREQVREQRQRRQVTDQIKQTRGSGNRRKSPSKNKSPWYLIGGIVLMVAVVVGIFIFMSNMQTASTKVEQAKTLKTLTSIDPKLLAKVGIGNAKSNLQATKDSPPLLLGPTGKPEVLYMGAEYCPFCAAQRWGLIVALSRFGTFGPLEAIISGEGKVPSYTFHNSTYTSQYIDFVALETQDNQFPNVKTLDTPTEAQNQIFQKYDMPPYTDKNNPGGIPFLSIGNKLVSSGSYYMPDVLVGLSYPEIEKQVLDPNSDVSKGILGTANYLTAAICSTTNNQPANVCTTDPIPNIQNSLPKAMASPVSGSSLALSNRPYEMIVRRPD